MGCEGKKKKISVDVCFNTAGQPSSHHCPLRSRPIGLPTYFWPGRTSHNGDFGRVSCRLGANVLSASKVRDTTSSELLSTDHQPASQPAVKKQIKKNGGERLRKQCCFLPCLATTTWLLCSNDMRCCQSFICAQRSMCNTKVPNLVITGISRRNDRLRTAIFPGSHRNTPGRLSYTCTVGGQN